MTVAAQQLLEETGDPGLKISFTTFTDRLNALTAQCAVVNTVLDSRKGVDLEIRVALSNLEGYIGNLLIQTTLAGEDTSYVEQLLVLVLSFKEGLLEINLLHTELSYEHYADPLREHDCPLLAELDDLLLRVRTMTASEVNIARLAELIVDHIGKYRESIVQLHVEIIKLSEKKAELAQSRQQTMSVIDGIERSIFQSVIQTNRQISRIIYWAGLAATFLSLLVIIIVIALNRFFIRKSIQAPMHTVLSGITALQQGDLNARVHLNRRDEWSEIENGLNNMAADLHTSYSSLQDSEVRYRDLAGQLQETAERLELTIEGASLGTWDWNIETGEVLFNERSADMLGYSLNEIESNIFTLQKFINTDEPEELKRKLTDHLKGRTSFYLTERRLRHKSGEWIWVLVAGKVFERNNHGKAVRALGILLDITDHKALEDELIRAKQELESVNVELEDRVKQKTGELLDSQLQVLHAEKLAAIGRLSASIAHEFNIKVNPAFCRMTGYGVSELLVMNVGDLVQPSMDSTLFSKIEAEKSDRRELTLLRKDDTTFIAEISSQPLQLDNRQLLLTLVQDITERKQAEIRLREAKIQADAVSTAKSEFLANMSHEIRTPLNSIVGRTHFALANTLDQETKSHLEMIAHSSQHLLALVNDIFDLVRIEADELIIEDKPFDLLEVIESCMKMATVQAENEGKCIELTCTVAPDVPQMARGDALRIQQLLVNLLGNSVKFTEKGIVSLSVTCLPGLDNELRLQFRVRDTGIGIAPDKLEVVFDTFTQADGSLTRKFEGAGLGLAICHHLCVLMGGDIAVESNLGTGSIFTFSLALHPVAIEDIPLTVESTEEEQASVIPRSLLLVDDNEANRFLARAILEKERHNITEAHNGLHALQLLAGTDYDAVLMDVQMPVMDGLSATRIIRDAECGRQVEGVERELASRLSSRLSGGHIPVIAITAKAMNDDRKICLEVGMDHYLTKPFQPQQLMDTLGQFEPGRVSQDSSSAHGGYGTITK